LKKNNNFFQPIENNVIFAEEKNNYELSVIAGVVKRRTAILFIMQTIMNYQLEY